MRPVVVFGGVVIVLGAALGIRFWWQQAEMHGPVGGSGTVEGTSVVVASRLGARVQTVPVVRGQQVAAGDVLVTLDCAETEATLAEAEARLAMAEAQAAAASASASATRRSGSASRQVSLAASAQAEALALQQAQAARSAERLEALGADVATDRREAARTQADGLDRQLSGARASQGASAAAAAASGDQATAAEASARAAAEGVRAAEATVARLRLLVGECVLRAPAPGYVETLPWHPGEAVNPGAIVARVVDIREVEATFYLPNAEVAAVVPGAAAEVVADAWPDDVFLGTVSTVTLTAEFTPRNVQTRSDRDRLVYPVVVRLPNPDGRLRPGMPVQVRLPGTER